MRADIVPFLALATGLDLPVAGKAFEAARMKALKRTKGVDDSRTFILTVEGFRAKHPFDLGVLTANRALDNVQNPKSTN
jgi:hypothetical protein